MKKATNRKFFNNYPFILQKYDYHMPKRKAGIPHTLSARIQQSRERVAKRGRRLREKMVDQNLEHSKNLEVGIFRIKSLTRPQLVERQTRFLIDLVKRSRPQNYFLYVQSMSPEEFRQFLIVLAHYEHH